jgi:hypothetical protein
VLGNAQYLRQRHAQLTARCDLCSAWRLDYAIVPSAGAPTPPDLPSPFGMPAAELAINSPTQAVLRDAIGTPSYIPIKTDTARHTLEFDGPGKNKTLFAITQPDPMHLVLTPIGDKAGKAATVSLTSATPPGGYPLLHRGFHWASEFPYER